MSGTSAWQQPKSGHEMVLHTDESGKESVVVRTVPIRDGLVRSEYVTISLGWSGESIDAIEKVLPALGWQPADGAVPAHLRMNKVADLHQRVHRADGKPSYCRECTRLVGAQAADGWAPIPFPCATYLAATGEQQS